MPVLSYDERDDTQRAMYRESVVDEDEMTKMVPDGVEVRVLFLLDSKHKYC